MGRRRLLTERHLAEGTQSDPIAEWRLSIDPCATPPDMTGTCALRTAGVASQLTPANVP